MFLLTAAQENDSLLHEWRSLTLRAFDPPQEDASANLALFQESAQRKASYYSYLTKKFNDVYSNLYRPLAPADAQRRHADLQAIISSTGDAFTMLARQRVRISASARRHEGSPFQSSSNEIELHPSLWSEEDELKADGKPVHMVVQPAILAFGDEEGKHYNQSKIWVKGVVWVCGVGRSK